MVSRSPKRQNKAKHKASQSSGSVRIISGLWKGRKLPVADEIGLRPTTDRVKETLFNWLMFDVRDAKVLDCFAGSGALSFEAASRGAAKVVMTELSKKACLQLTNNISQLKAPANLFSLIEGNALVYTAQPASEVYDIIFIDPPFRQNLIAELCNNLQKNGFLSTQSLVYIEHEAELTDLVLPDNWHLLKSSRAGQSQFNLYQVG
ncbi:16S rRNA (guanine(966)-N(2))-methyltransferase RsmD [Gayadomonas joobiniege]|uniref:16S rRNA (guanine(966)-N(2))-methyltransferase RsmD n=1 Tax=Gayadomonas joobiniege TaxID=1234606 RepID=UPI00037309D1|nr:16S rRNA (guanine(966)-N(2))-methyltransferase RsmD [Gayadomonas joobiniege]